jgi:hypothetical protein
MQACDVNNGSESNRIPSRDILTQYGVETNMGLNILALVLFALVCRVLTYLSLKHLLK